MPDQEDSFTFVDKRRPVAEDNAVENDEETDQPVDAPEVEAPPQEAMPDVYQMLAYFVNLLANQSWQYLGLIADPMTGQVRPDLDQAKVAIDAIGDIVRQLESSPEASIPNNDKKRLRTLLNDLRLNYVAQHKTQTVTPEA